jgi:hypothetical protein
MRRPSLQTEELYELWTAVWTDAQTAVPDDDAEGDAHVSDLTAPSETQREQTRLMTAGKDPNSIRQARRLFEYLVREHLRRSPVLVASVIPPGRPAQEAWSPGVVPWERLVDAASLLSYRLREPMVLRYLAIHNQGILAREGGLPTIGKPVGALDLLPHPRPADHWGTLLAIRDRLLSRLQVQDPAHIAYGFEFHPGAPPTVPGTSVRALDPAHRQFAEHTAGESWWPRYRAWEAESSAYHDAIRQLVAEAQEEAEARTGWSVAVGGYGPDKPVLLPQYFLVPLDGAVRLWLGRPGDGWHHQIEANHAPATLLAGVDRPGATVASGPSDQLERIAVKLSRLYETWCQDGRLVNIVKAYVRLEREATSLHELLAAITVETLQARSCWGCRLWNDAPGHLSETAP